MKKGKRNKASTECVAKNTSLSKDQTKNEDRKKKKEFRKKSCLAKNYCSSEEVQFARLLSELGMIITYVATDGNCMFRSIADQLVMNEEMHQFYRMKIMDYILHQKEHFSLFIEDDEPFDDYILRMRLSGEWGGHQELNAASQCLNVNIIIHQVDAPRFVLEGKCSLRTIHVSYHGEQHYNSVRLLEEKPPVVAYSNTSKKSLSDLSDTEIQVIQSVPWMPTDIIRWAIVYSDNDVDAAVELLLTNSETDLRDMITATNSISDEILEQPPPPPSLPPQPSQSPPRENHIESSVLVKDSFISSNNNNVDDNLLMKDVTNKSKLKSKKETSKHLNVDSLLIPSLSKKERRLLLKSHPPVPSSSTSSPNDNNAFSNNRVNTHSNNNRCSNSLKININSLGGGLTVII